ncbi:MAG: hypothetical protein ABSF28_01185 [Terracidiphilus sp.]|jgi:hypothetical protein
MVHSVGPQGENLELRYDNRVTIDREEPERDGMSEDEKSQQIARALQDHQRAKINLAHLRRKIDDVAEVYSKVGSALSSVRTDARLGFTIHNGHFEISDPRVKALIGNHLLNESGLVELLVAHK